MKLIIDIDERAYKCCLKLKSDDDMELLGLHLINATANGIPLEKIEELSHCPACVHYVQGDVPNIFCEKCKNRDELYRRINNDT